MNLNKITTTVGLNSKSEQQYFLFLFFYKLFIDFYSVYE